MDSILKKLVWVILLIPAVYLAIAWKSLPETVAMHFDWKGNVDRYGTKRELIGMLVVLFFVSVFAYLLLANIYRIDPKKYAVENKERLQRLAFGFVVFMAALQCMIIYSSTQNDIRFGLLFPGMGLLFAFIGNYMPNIKPNYFAGYRLPWTLESEDNWKKTHALVGKLWFGGGLLIAVVCIFLSNKASFIFFMAVMCVISITPVIYSYRYYLQQKKRNQHHS